MLESPVQVRQGHEAEAMVGVVACYSGIQLNRSRYSLEVRPTRAETTQPQVPSAFSHLQRH